MDSGITSKFMPYIPATMVGTAIIATQLPSFFITSFCATEMCVSPNWRSERLDGHNRVHIGCTRCEVFILMYDA